MNALSPPGEGAAASALRTIETEREGLVALAAALGAELAAPFEAAVDVIRKGTGRVVVSGVGKSGHVARKIAATLASTGTPSFFVHPAEASHGDLGMVTEADVALVLSNSGETPEIADIVAHTRRFRIPLIGVAGRAGSTLFWLPFQLQRIEQQAKAEGKPRPTGPIPPKLEPDEHVQDIGDAVSPGLTFVATGALLAGLVLLTIFARPALNMTDAIADQLFDTAPYVNSVLIEQEGARQ